MKGRKPKPTEQKIAEGNPGKRALKRPAQIGRLIEEAPQAPEHLSTSAKEAWGRLATILVPAGILRTGDLDAFEALCDAIGIRRMAAHDIRSHFDAEQTFVVRGARGMIAHPAIGIERSAADQVRKWAAHFGLTPSDRSRMGGMGIEGEEGREPEDDLAELTLIHGGPGA